MTQAKLICGFRDLTTNEIGSVAGGDGEGEGEEIIVTGTRMTQQQKDAYDSWHALMTFNVYAAVGVGAGAIAWGGWAVGGGIGAGIAAGGVVTAEALVDAGQEAIDQFIDEQASELYRYDGLDGHHDGYLGYANL